MAYDAQTWADCSEALAFVGNSLLAPMNQTGVVGLDPSFWEAFPDFGDAEAAAALSSCVSYARDAQVYAESGGSPVTRASVEYTKLFVGPPKPAAAPWETMYRSGAGSAVGFGQATFEMKELLREFGLEVSNENNQYADHIGIELLLASVLCARIAESEGDAGKQRELLERLTAFLEEHPLAWTGKLLEAVRAVEPEGYIAALLTLADAIMRTIGKSAA